MYKHYVRVNEKKEVINAFSDAFFKAGNDDFFLKSSDERHFTLDLQTMNGVYRYIFDGELKKRTESEIEQIEKPIIKRNAILARLAALDLVVPRATEDLYLTLGVAPYKTVSDTIAEKCELRRQLVEL